LPLRRELQLACVAELVSISMMTTLSRQLYKSKFE
jgi:hypothetical protein